MNADYIEQELMLDHHQKERVKVNVFSSFTEITVRKNIRNYRVRLDEEQLDLLLVKILKVKKIQEQRQHQRIEEFL
jgi:hypothetical protein